MQCLPETGKEVGETAPTESSIALTAAVPVWLQYDQDQITYFHVPKAHERRFSHLFSPLEYTDEWLGPFIEDMHGSLLHCSLAVHNTIQCLHITMTTGLKLIPGQHGCAFSVYNLLFDHFVIKHGVHELIFWGHIHECFRRKLPTFIISNPAPVVRRAFLELAGTYSFVFSINDNKDLLLNFEEIRKILGRIPDHVSATGYIERPVDPTTPDSIGITNDYLENFEYFLSRITVNPKGELERTYATEVARIFVEGNKCEDYVCELILAEIEVRPCAQGLGLGRLIMYVLILDCIENEIDVFQVSRALKPTQIMCKSMGFEYVKGTDDCYSITLEEMKKRALPEQCGIPVGLLSRDETNPTLFRLDRSRFPTAAELNDQDAVNARGKRKRPD
jgi:hypothetical protein